MEIECLASLLAIRRSKVPRCQREQDWSCACNFRREHNEARDCRMYMVQSVWEKDRTRTQGGMCSGMRGVRGRSGMGRVEEL